MSEENTNKPTEKDLGPCLMTIADHERFSTSLFDYMQAVFKTMREGGWGSK